MSTSVTRNDLQQLQGISPKVLRAFETLLVDTAAATEAVAGQVAATGSIQNATVLTLSSNAAFANERILSLDPNFFTGVDGGPGGTYTVSLINFIATNGGYRCTFNLKADTNLDMPVSGRVPSSADGPYADDAAAAAAGINVGEIYKRPAGVLAWRQV